MVDDYDPDENARKSYDVAIEAMREKSECGMTPEYRAFLAKKAPRVHATGLKSFPAMHAQMKPHQRDATAFCLKQGRAGLFLDTGLGKTFCELEFAKYTAEATNGYALILTPLAVAKQIEREAKRFGYDARVIRDQSEAKPGINICNYDRLEKLDPDEFGSVVLDESSILKSFSGKTTRALIQTFGSHRFRLAATATPAPNDHMELGNHSDFLSIMPQAEMLARWFVNDTQEASQQWRLKGHAVEPFWDWMASWSRMAETPADMGHDATGYILPKLSIHRHKVQDDVPISKDGLFAQDMSATSMFDIKRQTTGARADCIASKIDPKETWVIWCDTDHEADALKARLKDAIEVRGSMKIEAKEDALNAFANGDARIIITKPSIAGYGVNWQHCSNMAFVGRTFSYEAWYQAVRRCWRFGQTKPVNVHLAVAEGEDQIGRVIDRKSADHAMMKRAMADAMRRAGDRTSKTKLTYTPNHIGRLPSWLSVA